VADPQAPPARGLAACLAQLDAAIVAARALGLDVAAAEAVQHEAGERLSFATDVAVVALVGGTGVGKSTLLNALAGDEVSRASVRRPTTQSAVAWIPADERDGFAELLAWLGVEEVRTQADAGAPVAILDLPDLDSVEREHRERVEAVLPRVDGVIWVTDPEKYRDAVLHDDFLRQWVRRLDRQLVVLNKSDLLGRQVETVRRDLERSLAPSRAGAPRASTRVVAAAAGAGDIDGVRRWLDELGEAKRLVAGRVAASVQSAIDGLAGAAGVDPDGTQRAVVEPAVRRAAVDAAAAEVTRLLDLDVAEERAVAATRAVARRRGAGPLGRLTAFIYRASGRQAAVADPSLHLGRWSQRGSVAPAVDLLRRTVDEPISSVPLTLRPALAESVDGRLIGSRIHTAVDQAIAARTPMRPPSSRLWPVLALLQTLATLTIVGAVAWLVLLFLFRPPVDTVDLPALGPVPIPLVILVAGLVAGYVVARVLAWHAGSVGRRWARSLRSDVQEAVAKSVADVAFVPLDRVDAARRALWIAARGARESCGAAARIGA
jgi:GTPase SAR1 family protein